MIDLLEQHTARARRLEERNQRIIRTRKITWVVGSSLALLGVFIIAVCTLSWFSLQRFQQSLSGLSERTLPGMLDTATESFQLSQMLVSAERLIYVEDEAEQRLAYRDLRRQMDDLLSGPAMSPDMLQPARLLNNHFESLNDLVGEKLKNRGHIVELLGNMDTLVLDLIGAMAQHGHSEEDLSILNRASMELFRIMFEARSKVQEITAINPSRFSRNINRQLDVLSRTAQSSVNESPMLLLEAVEKARTALTGPGGLADALHTQYSLRSDIRSMHSVARGMMTELEASKVTRLNQLINRSGQLTQETRQAIQLFAHLFVGVTLLALILGLGVYIYFRKVFIIRLETLNQGLLEGVGGNWKDLDESGADELSTIASSVNYFARELRISTQMAEASNQAKTSFLANMSHEIRTPMNAVIGFNRMLSETPLDPKQREYIKKIDNSARLLLAIINDILDFSKIEAGKLDISKEPFELLTVIDNVVEGTEPKAREKGLSFMVNIDPLLPRVMIGDPLRLFQVCNNLCDNAVKFTAKGNVTLDVRKERELADGIRVRFSITDQGIGLTTDELARLFKPFTQADASMTRRYGGTGLGLTISRALCELMGGTVGVTSKPGEGSTFYFLVTLGKTDQQNLQAASQLVAKPPDLSGKKLLLVEDNIINQEIILDLLEKTRIETVIANNGQEALERMAATGPDTGNAYFDMVLMDIQMPVMDGLTASRKIRMMTDPHQATVPIIAMTAHAMRDDRQICLDVGMDDYMTKPVEPGVFYSMLSLYASDQG